MKLETSENTGVWGEWLGILLRIAAAVPWVSIVLLYSLAVYVRMSFGRWPVPMIDSVHLPILIECFFPFVFVFLILPGFLYMPIFAAIWIPLCYGFKARRHLLSVSLVLMAGWLVELMLVLTDPWGFISWYGD